MLEVRNSEVHGRGVFATKRIPIGYEFSCDVILIRKKYDLPESLHVYTFPWDSENFSICLGFASFLNHNRNPNMKINRIDKENLKKYFITLNVIEEGDELFLRYNKNIKEFCDV